MELKKYEIIKETIKGRESKLSASVKLGVTIRTINFLITRDYLEGIGGFI